MTKYDLWSWHDFSKTWMKIQQNAGTDDVERIYQSAAQHALTGAAFALVPAGEQPQGTPVDLQVPIVPGILAEVADTQVEEPGTEELLQHFHPKPTGSTLAALILAALDTTYYRASASQYLACRRLSAGTRATINYLETLVANAAGSPYELTMRSIAEEIYSRMGQAMELLDTDGLDEAPKQGASRG